MMGVSRDITSVCDEGRAQEEMIMRMAKYSMILAVSAALSLPAVAQVGLGVGQRGSATGSIGGGPVGSGLGVGQSVGANVDAAGKPVGSAAGTTMSA